LVVKIALALFSTTFVTSALGFVFWTLAARLAAPEIVGRSAAVISSIEFIAAFATLGLHTLLIGELPRCNREIVKRLVVSSLTVAATVGFAVALAYAIIHHQVEHHESMYATPGSIALFGIGAAVSTAAVVFDGALVGLQHSSLQVVRNLVFAVTKLLGLPLGAMSLGMSPEVVVLVWVIGNLVSLVWTAARSQSRMLWLRTAPSMRGFIPIWRTAAGHHWVNVAMQAPRLALPVLVASQLGSVANAAFYAALLMVSFVWIIPNHLGVAMFALHSGDPQHFKTALDTAIRISMVVSVAAALGGPILAVPLLSIFGPAYVGAKYCFMVLAFCTFATAIKAIYIAVRRAQGTLATAARVTMLAAMWELAGAQVGLMLGGLTGVGIGLGAAAIVEAAFLWPAIVKSRRQPPELHVVAAASAGEGDTEDPQHSPEAELDRQVTNNQIDGRMRILVEHSGYALVNIGDIAMLQGCVHRLRSLWPDAEILVFTESADRLRVVCPGAEPVVPSIAGHWWASWLPETAQLVVEQIWKIATAAVGGYGRRRRRFPPSAPGRRVFQREAIHRADIVVSSGGGFVNDIFWYHAAGVLSVLGMAQRRGKPTAMFGQGMGPLTRPLPRHFASRVLQRLRVIGLREGNSSVGLLESFHVDAKHVHVTGDDALVLVTPSKRPVTGSGIGLNVRVASYSEVTADVGESVVATTRRVAAENDLPILALPVENNRAISDWEALRAGLPNDDPNSFGEDFSDIDTPAELAKRVALCKVIVTGSYHAAVFSLAVGVPAVCLTNSRYYDDKFIGLKQLFPGGCFIVHAGDGLERELTAAIEDALAIGEAARDCLHQAALEQVARGDEAYRKFKTLISAGVNSADGTEFGLACTDASALALDDRQ
jgi:polysaccharide pyruvyl transferase WcaK-like protein/O-antigen/teichoic acid export membrane protein